MPITLFRKCVRNEGISVRMSSMAQWRNALGAILLFSSTAAFSANGIFAIHCESAQSGRSGGFGGFSLKGEFRPDSSAKHFQRIWIRELSLTEESIIKRDEKGILASETRNSQGEIESLEFGWSPGKSKKYHEGEEAFSFSLRLSKGAISTLAYTRNEKSRFLSARCSSENVCAALRDELARIAVKIKRIDMDLAGSLDIYGKTQAKELEREFQSFKFQSKDEHALDRYAQKVRDIQDRLENLPKSLSNFEKKLKDEKEGLTARKAEAQSDFTNNKCD